MERICFKSSHDQVKSGQNFGQVIKSGGLNTPSALYLVEGLLGVAELPLQLGDSTLEDAPEESGDEGATHGWGGYTPASVSVNLLYLFGPSSRQKVSVS